MDQFTYLADPAAQLRLANQRYQDEIKRAERRNAMRLEARARATATAGQGVQDELVSRPARAGLLARLSWHSLLHPRSDGARSALG